MSDNSTGKDYFPTNEVTDADSCEKAIYEVAFLAQRASWINKKVIQYMQDGIEKFGDETGEAQKILQRALACEEYLLRTFSLSANHNVPLDFYDDRPKTKYYKGWV